MPPIDLQDALESWRRAFAEARRAQVDWFSACHLNVDQDELRRLRDNARDTQALASEMLTTALRISEEEVEAQSLALRGTVRPCGTSLSSGGGAYAWVRPLAQVRPPCK